MNTIIRFTGFAVLSMSLVACNETTDTKKQASVDATISDSSLSTLAQKAAYSFGVDIASRLKEQGVSLDVTALNAGINDAFSGNQYALTEAVRNEAKASFQKQLQETMLAKIKLVADKNLKLGEAFLAQNAKKPGVVTTDSGLQYKIITQGTGTKPKASDTVTTNYKGTLIDGKEFDSSYKRNAPATFPVGGVIKGWTEALQLMKVGAKWQLFIPANLAYGEMQRSALIEPNSTLIFELELLSIKGDEVDAKKDNADKK